MTLTDTNRYDVIAVTGSLPVYDERFQRMLKIGGRLFVAVGSAPVMDAQLVRRVSADQWVRESLFETVIEPLINAPEPPRFLF
jgi:protein-L-isoaspartate(D-aspartate) O-methyltransferase